MFRRWIPKLNTNEIAAIGLFVTVVIAAIYFLQLVAMQHSVTEQRNAVTQQIHAIRVDQRAWMNVRITLPDRVTFKEGEQLSIPLQMSNTGKTPASKVEIYVFSDFLPTSQAPQFGGRYALKFGCGVVMPNSPPVTLTVSPTQLTPEQTRLPNPVVGKPIIVTPDINKALADGSRYIVTSGFLVYDDIFHKNHRFQFCSFVSNDAFHWMDTARPCVDYNKIDDEEE